MRILVFSMLWLPLIAFAQAQVEVENVAGGIERAQAQEVLSAMAEPLGECFGDHQGSLLATLRTARSGRVVSIQLMELSGVAPVDRCVVRALRDAQLGSSPSRSTIYVRISHLE